MSERIERILVAVDGSPSSHKAVRLASQMARALGSSLVLVHVSHVVDFPSLIVEAEDPGEEEEAQRLLGQAARIARSLGVEASVVVRKGRVVDQLLSEIRSRRPQLVLLGTRGLTGAKGVLLGSVSQAVSRRARTTVVLVR